MIDWQRIWNEDDSIRRVSPTRAILHLFSLLYRLAVNLRNRLYDQNILKSAKLSCPVLSVGNITVGGTGKTPCVILIAKLLQQQGIQPAVISRGYGGKSRNSVNIVSDREKILLDAREAGDEPLLIACSLPGVPVVTGAKRILTGQAAIDRFGAQVLICDDAFQHRQIVRDIDIVLLDAEKPLGNGHFLPRGELRESPKGLERASCLILTRADETGSLHPDVMQIARKSNIPVFRSSHRFMEMITPDEQLRLHPDDLRGRKICAFCGIAKPQSFKKLLLEAGMEIASFISFADHHVYNRHDLEDLKTIFTAKSADYWVTTEKDAMRLAGYPEFLKRICILRMKMEISPSQPSFENFLAELLVASQEKR